MPTGLTEAVQRAREQLMALTGFAKAIAVGASKDEEGWRVTVDLLELARIPPSTDVIGTYLATMDSEGNLIKFEKIRSRQRGEPYEEGPD